MLGGKKIMSGRHTECLYFSSSGAPRAAPNPSISRVLEWFSREKTRYFSNSGAPRARPNPSISRVLERFSLQKTRYFSSSGAPRARPNPSISRVLEWFSPQKTRYFSNSGAPRAPPGKGAEEPRTGQPPAGLTTYHKYTSILTKRKHKPQTAHTRSELDRLAGPRGRRTSPACGSCRRPLKRNEDQGIEKSE